MQSRDYRELLNALLQAQSEDELIVLVRRNPQVHTEEFMNFVQRQTLQMSCQEREVLVNQLLRVGSILNKNPFITILTEDLLVVPEHIPPSGDPRAVWVKPFREYIAQGFGNDIPLQAAVYHAQRADESEILSLLSLLEHKQYERATDEASRLFTLFQKQNRLEEAYSLQLLRLVRHHLSYLWYKRRNFSRASHTPKRQSTPQPDASRAHASTAQRTHAMSDNR